jgi:hypothetical protein
LRIVNLPLDGSIEEKVGVRVRVRVKVRVKVRGPAGVSCIYIISEDSESTYRPLLSCPLLSSGSIDEKVRVTVRVRYHPLLSSGEAVLMRRGRGHI